MSSPPHKRISSPIELFSSNSAASVSYYSGAYTSASSNSDQPSGPPGSSHAASTEYTAPAGIGITIPHHPITTVMSTAGDDFLSKYELLGEIGSKYCYLLHASHDCMMLYDADVLWSLYIPILLSAAGGGFSVVHHCRNRMTGKSFAAKVTINLLPTLL
jgi:hypothetical protein